MKKLFQFYKPYYQSNLKLAIPVVISQLGHTLVQVSDSVIVGHFAGTIPLAAVSLVNSVFSIVLIVGIGISYGLTPLIAQANGRKEYQECSKLLANSFYINVLTSITLFIIINYGLLLVIDHLGQSPEVTTQAKPYLHLLGLSIIPLMVFNTFKQFAEGLGLTKQAMMISIWGNILNIILGIIFVKGIFGISPMGVKGVGLSTLIDRCVMAAAMCIYVFKSKHFKIYLRNFTWKQFEKARSMRILKIGAPVALQYIFEVGAFSCAAILMGMIGTLQLAAHQVAISLASITYMMSSGIAAAATIKTGNNFGQRNITDLKRSALSSYHIVLAFMCITAFMFFMLNNLLPWIYTSDTKVIEIAAQLLVIAAFFQFFDGTQVVSLGILRGMGDVNIPTLITFIAYWIIGIPVAYLTGIFFNWGANGIWFGLTLGLLVSSGFLYLRFNYSTRKLINQTL